jgi:hypothetical protein
VKNHWLQQREQRKHEQCNISGCIGYVYDVQEQNGELLYSFKLFKHMTLSEYAEWLADDDDDFDDDVLVVGDDEQPQGAD